MPPDSSDSVAGGHGARQYAFAGEKESGPSATPQAVVWVAQLQVDGVVVAEPAVDRLAAAVELVVDREVRRVGRVGSTGVELHLAVPVEDEQVVALADQVGGREVVG